MGLFPKKYCNQTHIQSQLYQRQKMIFYGIRWMSHENVWTQHESGLIPHNTGLMQHGN